MALKGLRSAQFAKRISISRTSTRPGRIDNDAKKNHHNVERKGNRLSHSIENTR